MDLSCTTFTQDLYLIIDKRSSIGITFHDLLLFLLWSRWLRAARFLEWRILKWLWLCFLNFLIKRSQVITSKKMLLELILIFYLFFSLLIAVCSLNWFFTEFFDESQHVFRRDILNSRLLEHRLDFLLSGESWPDFPLWWNYWIL